MASLKSPYRTPILRPFLQRKLQAKKYIRPYSAISNVTSLCPRAFYYASRFEGKEYIQELRASFNFIMGFIAEDFVNRIVQQAGISVVDKEIELELSEEDRVGLIATKGRIDYLLRYPNGKYYLAEVKKMNPNRFNLFKVRGLQTEQAAHFQLLFYLKMWRDAIKQGQDLPPVSGILIGVQTEPTDIIDTSIEYRYEDFEQFIPQLEIIEAYKIAFEEEKKLGKDAFDIQVPKRPENLNVESYACKACTFYKECYDEYPNTIEKIHLTTTEIEAINGAIIDIRRAWYQRKDAEKLNQIATDTLKGLMQLKEARSLEFKSSVGALLVEVSFIEKEKLDSSELIKNHANLVEKYTTKSTEYQLNTEIKLSPEMEALASGRIKKITKDGKLQG